MYDVCVIDNSKLQAAQADACQKGEIVADHIVLLDKMTKLQPDEEEEIPEEPLPF